MRNHKWDVEAKNPESFAIWLYCCNGRSYLRTKSMNEAKNFASVIELINLLHMLQLVACILPSSSQLD